MSSTVKWSGSKTYVAKQITGLFPPVINTYYEPFTGGGSIFLSLLNEKYIHIKKFVCSDINAHLIAIWNEIKDNPERMAARYAELHQFFNTPQEAGISQIQGRKDNFNTIREMYNSLTEEDEIHVAAEYLYFLTRTSINGIVRYNRSGKYNGTPHFTRPGMTPSTVREMLVKTSKILNRHNIVFKAADYQTISPQNEDDFMFADPPYDQKPNEKLYYGNIDSEKLQDYMNSLPCQYILTFNKNTNYNKGETLALKDTEMIFLPSVRSKQVISRRQSTINEIMYIKRHTNLETGN
jgi:DNA adenine methylase